MEKMTKLFSIEKTAEILDVSPWTIRLWITKRKLASVKLGSRRLVSSTEIERLIADSTIPATTAKGAD